MNKRMIGLLLTMTLTASVLFVGCGDEEEEVTSTPPAQTQQTTQQPQSTPEDDIKKAAEDFLSAVDSGDLDAIVSASSSELLESKDFRIYQFGKDLRESLGESLMSGVTESEPGDKTKAEFDDMAKSMLDLMVVSYRINDVKADGASSGTVSATITYSIDMDKVDDMSDLNVADEDMPSDDIFMDYYNEHKDELEQMEKDGKSEDEMTIKMIDDLMPELSSAMVTAVEKALDKADDTNKDYELTLSKEGADWTVTEMKAEGGSSSSDDEDSSSGKSSDASDEDEKKESESDDDEAYSNSNGYNEEIVELCKTALAAGKDFQDGSIDAEEAQAQLKPIQQKAQDITEYVEKNGYEKYTTSDLLLLTTALNISSDIAFIDLGNEDYNKDLKEHIEELEKSLK